MLQNQHIINALPLVADVLGRKYGVRVHIGGRDAYTDGHPDSVTVAQGAMRTGTTIGYEIYGIGIGENSGIRELLPASSMTILNLQELASAMFTILSKSLLNNPSGLKLATNQN